MDLFLSSGRWEVVTEGLPTFQDPDLSLVARGEE